MYFTPGLYDDVIEDLFVFNTSRRWYIGILKGGQKHFSLGDVDLTSLPQLAPKENATFDPFEEMMNTHVKSLRYTLK